MLRTGTPTPAQTHRDRTVMHRPGEAPHAECAASRTFGAECAASRTLAPGAAIAGNLGAQSSRTVAKVPTSAKPTRAYAARATVLKLFTYRLAIRPLPTITAATVAVPAVPRPRPRHSGCTQTPWI